MTIYKPSGLEKKEERELVDREEHIDLFKDFLGSIRQKEHSFLVYYGVTGSGETRVVRKLLQVTEEYNLYNLQKVNFAFIDS